MASIIPQSSGVHLKVNPADSRSAGAVWPRASISEIPDHLRPFHIDFIEQKGGDWLVAFKAENILASLYVKMTGTEMASLLERAAQ